MSKGEHTTIVSVSEDAEDIDEISLRFNEEDVFISQGEGGEAVVRQEAGPDFPADRAMRARTEGRVLIAEADRFPEPLFGRRAASEIRLSLPAETRKDARVKTASGDIYADGAAMGRGEFSSKSGDIVVTDGAFEILSAQGTSGDVRGRDVRCPKTRAQSTSGDIRMERLRGLAEGDFKSTSGDIELADTDLSEGDPESATGGIRARSTSGDVRVSRVRIPAEADLQSTSGDVVMEEVEVRGLRCDTTSGDIRVRAKRISRFAGGSKSGDIDIAIEDPASLESVDAKSLSGDVCLRVPPGTALQISFQSASGRMKTAKASGIALGGEGAVPVSVRTASGNLIVRSL